MTLTKTQDAKLRAVQARAVNRAEWDLIWIRHRLLIRRLSKPQRRAARRKIAEVQGMLTALAEALQDEPPAWLLPPKATDADPLG